MGFDQRNLLKMAQNVYLKVSDLCPCKPDKHCVYSFPPCCAQKCPSPPLPPPPPPLRPMGGVDSKQKHLLTVSMGVTASMIAIGLLFAIFCTAIRVYYLRRNNSRRRNPPILFGIQDDFLDENQGSTIDHPIWYINTVGLPQSVIDSITVFNYRKDEGLIEGTECSVCLSEFQEDENLRLLPKCSHAFHISCIDTWLRSHKNCPLCRAPIICGTIAPQATQSEPSLNNLDSRNEDNVVENHSGEEASNMREGGTSEVRNVHDHGCVHAIDVYTAENSNNSVPLLKTRNSDSDSRVLSDLAGKRRVVEEEMQPMRRSVSLDSPSAMTIYTDVANVVVNNGKQHLASFDTQSISEPNNSKSKMVAKPTSVSSSISKLMKSSSIGSSLQKGPILMKRSFSFSGKRSSSKHGRRHSVLPL